MAWPENIRAMVIACALYPLHLAISSDWKVHYFTADMANSPAYRAEERRFLEDMPTALGAPAMSVLARIGEMLALDYCGIDFALEEDGAVILFEANATMMIPQPPPGPIWDYRRAPVDRTLAAARDMLLAKADRVIRETKERIAQ